MTTSRLDERIAAEAAAADWWQRLPYPPEQGVVSQPCGACGATITTPEGTSIVESFLLCPACTDRTFGLPESAAEPPTTSGIGPPLEQMPERPEIPEAMYNDSPWATTGGGQLDAPAPPVPPLMTTAPAPVLPPRRRRRALIVVGLALATALSLVVALVLWAPWGAKPPGPPANVSATPAAASVTLHWIAPRSGAPVEHYLVMRDGTQIASVPVGTTSYVDEGLTPGVTYRYSVVAEGNEQSSTASTVVTTTATPSPGFLRVAATTTSAVTLRWSAPPDSPSPDRYVITSGTGQIVGTVSGSVTTYLVKGLDPASKYVFTVVAYWGDSFSGPSSRVTATTSKPPVAAARLAGSLPVTIKVVATGGGTLTKGKHWADTWNFSPKCHNGACTTVLHGDITPPGTTTHSFTVTLHRNGAVYTGSTPAHITHCGMAPLATDVHSTLSVSIRALSGHMVNGNWVVDRWKGTVRMVSPYTSAGMYYCPSQTVVMTLTGS